MIYTAGRSSYEKKKLKMIIACHFKDAIEFSLTVKKINITNIALYVFYFR